MDNLALETMVVPYTNKGMATGALTGLIGFFASINWLGLIGALVAIVGLGANIYFQLRRDRRETAESLARRKALHERCEE